MEATDRFFFEATGQAIAFLQGLDQDRLLAAKCAQLPMSEKLNLARQLGFDFSETNLRMAIRIWDYHGTWRTRLGMWPEARATSAPDLQSSYPLKSNDIERYRQDGHVLLRGVLSRSEVTTYREVIRDVVTRFDNLEGEAARAEARSFEGAGFMSVINLRTRDALAAKYVLARRFAKIAAELIGVPRVRVYLDETFNKEAGGGPTHWHQDRLYFPPDTNELITMWMPLVDASEQMGTLVFASGSHKRGDFGYHPIEAASHDFFDSVVKENRFPVSPSGRMEAGDATFHNGWLLHCAAGNESAARREAMTVVYYPDGVRLCEPRNEYQRRAIELGYRKSPGDVAASPIHPIVYDSDIG